MVAGVGFGLDFDRHQCFFRAGLDWSIKHFLCPDFQLLDQRLFCFLLCIYARRVNEPANPPGAAFLSHSSILHGLLLLPKGYFQVPADFSGKLIDDFTVTRDMCP